MKPKKPTVALWLQFADNEYRTHEFMLGGPALNIKFALSKMMGLSGKDENVDVSIEVDPSSLRFRRGSCVSTWKTIGTMFQGKIDTSKDMDWTTGPQLLTRFRIIADDTCAATGKSELVLEAIVMPEDQTFEGLAPDVRQKLERGGSRTFLLWSTRAEWYLPSAKIGLMTTPGISLKDEGEAPSDPVIRWALHWALDLTRKRGHVTTAQEWEPYLKNPTIARSSKVPYSFVVSTTKKPQFAKPSGETCSHVPAVGIRNQASLIKITQGKRKGLVLDLDRRRKYEKRVVLPQDTAPAKYNPEPHPLLELERNALPPETSEEIFKRAKENFSASISGGTQTVYACTARHVLEAERILGKKFASPPSEKDQLYFLTYLQAGVQKILN